MIHMDGDQQLRSHLPNAREQSAGRPSKHGDVLFIVVFMRHLNVTAGKYGKCSFLERKIRGT